MHARTPDEHAARRGRLFSPLMALLVIGSFVALAPDAGAASHDNHVKIGASGQVYRWAPGGC